MKDRLPHPGAEYVVQFDANPKPHPEFRRVASHLGARRAEKLVVCRDASAPVGVPVRVRVVAVSRPSSSARGHIEVAYLGRAERDPYAGLYVDPFTKRRFEAHLAAGTPVLLEGPQGCGKSSLAEAAANATDMVFVRFNASAVLETTDFLATLQLAVENGATRSLWLRTEIGLALERAAVERDRRFMVFIDELNRCRELARNGIMPILDGSRVAWDPSTAAWLPVPKNMVFVAAVNIGDGFTGTTALDLAQVDRFAVIQVDYPPREAEEQILVSRFPTVAAAHIRAVTQVAATLRTDPELRLAVSVRATQEVCQVLSDERFRQANDEELAMLIRAAVCGRLRGAWDDPSTEAGVASTKITEILAETPTRRRRGG
ncbi:MAG: AAA family ATPase [Phycisphaerales bacterium]|nr:AAA family ATPase [Phycisphaerales bacterium]